MQLAQNLLDDATNHKLQFVVDGVIVSVVSSEWGNRPNLIIGKFIIMFMGQAVNSLL